MTSVAMKLRVVVCVSVVAFLTGGVSGCGPSSTQAINGGNALAAQLNVHAVANAIESCAAGDLQGTYASCATDSPMLQKERGFPKAVSSSLSQFGTCDPVRTGSCVTSIIVAKETYSVTATATTSPGPTYFTLSHDSLGQTTKSCKPTSDACPNGIWDS